ncbi:hypothetical protein NDU88_009578 [Pleurodeles waltl]|uniref:Uncharacterized protein n=1 Tax=Pleurodeles waltl TaxID=8319 RepID=A0AAV7RVL3_PLEWA|nr:hypothetical protein NDU88_009578 [Pleurodeles waltl]
MQQLCSPLHAAAALPLRCIEPGRSARKLNCRYTPQQLPCSIAPRWIVCVGSTRRLTCRLKLRHRVGTAVSFHHR